jgi:UDP-N-acetylglucosamine 4-epimerase
MNTAYTRTQNDLRSAPRRWLVTGAAGFIGSHVVEKLLSLGQTVRVMDNFFSSGPHNLTAVREIVGAEAAARLEFREGDIRKPEECAAACSDMDQVIHLAALGIGAALDGSAHPLPRDQCHRDLEPHARCAAVGIRRFVYASSSAVYGDDALPFKQENSIGKPLSPYAASKFINEVYASTLLNCYQLETVGLRFFNVFGPRQDPKGAYAAVIPCWIDAMKKGEPVFINGDGENTRDFCFVRDVVQSLILASTTTQESAFGRAFNVGLGSATNLNQLFETIRTLVEERTAQKIPDVIHRDFRAGDIRHSCADTTQVTEALGFAPEYSVMQGLSETVA